MEAVKKIKSGHKPVMSTKIEQPERPSVEYPGELSSRKYHVNIKKPKRKSSD
jgi:hypothetical protein